jgi:hypothetical protein
MVGWRQFLFAIWRLPRVWRHSSLCGSPDMACPPTSLQTEAGSLHQASGAASASGLGYLTSLQQPIILSSMVWWNVHTGKLRMLCALSWPDPSGLYTSLGFSSASVRLQRRSQPSLQRSWCLELPSLSLGSSLQQWSSLLPTTSSSSCLQHLFLRGRLRIHSHGQMKNTGLVSAPTLLRKCQKLPWRGISAVELLQRIHSPMRHPPSMQKHAGEE